MQLTLRRVEAALSSRWFAVAGSVASVAGLAFYLEERTAGEPLSIAAKTWLLVSVAAFVGAFFYSIIVRSENIALRDIASFFNEINEIYRDALRELFGGERPVTDPGDLVAREEKVLTSVCQRVEKIFTRVMFGRPCMVTLKLVVREENGRYFAHTYVRSETECVRDKPQKVKYEIGTGQNTAFDQARLNRSDGKPHTTSPRT